MDAVMAVQGVKRGNTEMERAELQFDMFRNAFPGGPKGLGESQCVAVEPKRPFEVVRIEIDLRIHERDVST